MTGNSFLRLFRSQWLLIVLLVTALAAFGCETDDEEDAAGADAVTGGATGGGAMTSSTITINADGSFDPSTLTVAAGTIVTFQNNSSAEVSLRIAQSGMPLAGFPRTISANGGSFTWNAATAGEYTANDENNTGGTGAMTNITVQ